MQCRGERFTNRLIYCRGSEYTFMAFTGTNLTIHDLSSKHPTYIFFKYVSAFKKELDQSLAFLTQLVPQVIDYWPSS